MVDGAKQIKIGQYRTGDYGIAVSTDGGITWQTAIDFDGLHGGGGGQTIIYQDMITKAELAPLNPAVNDLWIDTIEKRLKLWDGENWVNIGYEPTEPDPTDPDTPGGDDPDPTDPDTPGGGENPDDPGGEGAEPENPGGDDPVDPGEDNPEDSAPGSDDTGGDDSGSGTDAGDNEDNTGGEEPSEEGGGS